MVRQGHGTQQVDERMVNVGRPCRQKGLVINYFDFFLGGGGSQATTMIMSLL